MKKIILLLTISFGMLVCPSIILGQTGNYVSLKNKQFMLNGEKWFPITMNYHVDIVYYVDNQTTSYFIAPYDDYGHTFYYDCENEIECQQKIKDDFQQLADNGFNSVRIIGQSVEYGPNCDDNVTRYGPPSMQCPQGSAGPIPTYLVREFVPPSELATYPIQPVPWPNTNSESHPFVTPYTDHFSYLQKILDAAASVTGVDFKVQFLIGGKRITEDQYRSGYTDYLQAVSSHFANNSTLYSYDFYNEPLYNMNKFHISPYTDTKQEVCNLVDEWNNAIHNNAPNHLTTIGLIHSGEITLYDPGNLHLDFLSFHVYPYSLKPPTTNTYLDALNNVKRHIRWIAETSELPWIIGETGFQAKGTNTDSKSPSPDYGTLPEQADYAQKTLEFVRDNGGSGYSWWLFSDEAQDWGANFGWTDQDDQIKPLLKDKFANFDPEINTNQTIADNIYYNTVSTIYSLQGTIKDLNNLAIKNAVILGWDGNWKNHVHTYSKPDGSFTLNSDNPILIVRVAAIKSNIYAGSLANPLNIVLSQVQPDNMYVNGAILTNDYVNYGSIIVNNSLSENGNASIMTASNVIQLKTGFKVMNGGYFKGKISSVFTSCALAPNFRLVNNNDPTNSKAHNDISYVEPEKNKVSALNNPSLLLSPNPNNGQFNIELKNNDETVLVEVYDLMGKKVFTQNNTSTKLTINIKDQPKGIYLVRITIGDEVFNEKVIYH